MLDNSQTDAMIINVTQKINGPIIINSKIFAPNTLLTWATGVTHAPFGWTRRCQTCADCPFTVKIPIASSTTDTRSETDFHIRGWLNKLSHDNLFN